jgi:hypothetical protein
MVNILVHDVRSVLLTQYFPGNEIEKKEMGGACSACGEEERRVQAIVGGN